MQEVDRNVFTELAEIKNSLSDNLDNFHFRDALKDAMNIARLGNKYLQETEPWKVAKADMDRTATILNVAVQLCANIAVAFEPFLPFMSGQLVKMLGMASIDWDMLGTDDIIAAGSAIGQPELLFEKIEDDVIEAQVKRLEDIKRQNQLDNWKVAPQAENVDFDTFKKCDIRVGTVIECVKVPKADKLLKFLIDDGMAKRTIVSGIAKYYNPEDLIGKQVCFIANFEPRKLRGILSEGMILSAENPDGSLVVIGPTAPVRPGAQVM